MSGSEGYIYVLVNVAMPGLVKVGKTKRDPAGRAQELSGATGVATPFIVVFDQIFSNCDTAEMLIHRSLERSGLRPAPNREFFRASPSEVIKLIMATHSAIEEASTNVDQFENGGTEYGQHSDSWGHLLRQAHLYYYGLGDNLEDHEEAYRLYCDAARLGSVEALDILGWMNFNGEGVSQNHRAALQWWKEGVARGDYYCHASMAKAFVFRGEAENASKCWNAFFKNRGAAFERNLSEYDTQERYIAALTDYLTATIDKGVTGTFLQEVRLQKANILDFLTERRTSARASDFLKAASWRATWWLEGDHDGTQLASQPDGNQQSPPTDQRLQAIVDQIIAADGQHIASNIIDDIRTHRDNVLFILSERRNKEGNSDAYKAAMWRATWLIEDTLKD